MSLNILIGFDSPACKGAATTLYAGPSGAEIERLRAENTTFASFLILKNPVGIRKSNPRYVEPAAQPAKKKAGRKAADEAPASAPDEAPPASESPGLL